ncbi:uncharacterized protein LOC143225345 [Tachypleus tridentatus]|uniref:uncharacterized protein LOC143225345 n=1 Tax=Tachypleus tridentatus TaxID=6853 RepID=UPI003FD575DE
MKKERHQKECLHSTREDTDFAANRNGEARTKIMKEIGVPESTLRGWLKNEDQLREFCNQVDRMTGLQRKKAKTAADPAVDMEVYDWFVRLRADNIPISGPMVLAKAEKTYQQLYQKEDWQPTHSWLQKFKERHGINQNKGLKEAAPEPQPEPIEEKDDIFHGFTAEEVAEAERKFVDYQDGLPLTTLVKQWAEIDEVAPVTQPPLTDEEIQKAIENPAAAPTDFTTPDEEEEDDPIPEELRNCITSTQAVQYTEQLLYWAEHHNLGICKILQIQDLMRTAKRMRNQRGRQQTLLEAFERKKTTEILTGVT